MPSDRRGAREARASPEVPSSSERAVTVKSSSLVDPCRRGRGDVDAVATLRSTATSVGEVTIVCFDEETFDAYSEILTPR